MIGSQMFARVPQRWRPHNATILAFFSFLSTVWLPLTTKSEIGEITGAFTDHIRHTFSVWVWLSKGFDIYRVPFRVASEGVVYPFPGGHLWADSPMLYPPGLFATFAVPAVIGRYVPMEGRTFCVMTVVWVLFLAHGALAVWWRAISDWGKGERALVGALLWIIFVKQALNGFYDPTWALFAGLAALAYRQKKDGPAVLWFALAAVTHYRAIVFLPLALGSFLRVVRALPPRRWPWGFWIPSAGLGGLSAYTFWLMTQIAPKGSGAFREFAETSHVPLVLAGVTLAILPFALRGGGLLAGTTVLLTAAAGAADLVAFRSWWHASVGISVWGVCVAMPTHQAKRFRDVATLFFIVFVLLVYPDGPGSGLGLANNLADNFKMR